MPRATASRTPLRQARRRRGARVRRYLHGLQRVCGESRRIDTDGFQSFRSPPLTGAAAPNKGVALFPRRIGASYRALSRWDRENNAIARSVDGYHWDDATELQTPAEPWELTQLGKCGAPLETDAGWLVLAHGVGLRRGYAIGALLRADHLLLPYGCSDTRICFALVDLPGLLDRLLRSPRP